MEDVPEKSDMDISAISNVQLAQVNAEVAMSALKTTLEVEAAEQLQMAQMMQELVPYLGQQVDISA